MAARARYEPEAIDRVSVDRDELGRWFPPRWMHPNKAAVWDMVSDEPSAEPGLIEYSRWSRVDAWPGATGEIDVRCWPGPFAYGPESEGWSVWHLNFADPELFGYFAGPLLAQDEMQVLEHPSLGSLRHLLERRVIVDHAPPPRTVDDDGSPTPVLVRGALRRCRIDTAPDAAQGRPHGLYGNHFARADEEAVRRAITLLRPPTVSNIIAMAAPACGIGPYTRDEIVGILRTCVTGLSAVKAECRSFCPGRRIEFVTGWWGCGAFGGNRTVMAVTQLAAASWCGIDRLSFAAFNKRGTNDFEIARALWQRLRPLGPEDLAGALEAQGFEWGESDGN